MYVNISVKNIKRIMATKTTVTVIIVITMMMMMMIVIHFTTNP